MDFFNSGYESYSSDFNEETEIFDCQTDLKSYNILDFQYLINSQNHPSCELSNQSTWLSKSKSYQEDTPNFCNQATSVISKNDLMNSCQDDSSYFKNDVPQIKSTNPYSDLQIVLNLFLRLKKPAVQQKTEKKSLIRLPFYKNDNFRAILVRSHNHAIRGAFKKVIPKMPMIKVYREHPSYKSQIKK